MSSSAARKPARSRSSEPVSAAPAASFAATLPWTRYSPAANSSAAALIEPAASDAARAARRSNASATEASRWSQLGTFHHDVSIAGLLLRGIGAAVATVVAALAGHVAVPPRMVHPRPRLGHRAARHRAERTGQRRGAEIDVSDDRGGKTDEATVVEHPGDARQRRVELAREPQHQAGGDEHDRQDRAPQEEP